MSYHILVIDDEPALGSFLALYLSRQGFLVTTTTRGADGLRLLDEYHFHLVVLDVVLIDCDGLEILSEIKKVHPALPVLMLTGLGYNADALHEAKHRGAAGYLSKTLTTPHLLLEIRRLLNPPGGNDGQEPPAVAV